MTDEQAAAMVERGFVVVPSVLDAGSVTGALADLRMLREHLGLADGGLVAAPPGWRFADLLATDDRVAGLAASALGGPVVCFGFTYLVKAAGAGAVARWHQDGGPWRERLGGAPAVTVWLALTPADPTNGGLRVVPGTQHEPLQPLTPDLPGMPSLFGVGLPAGAVDERRAVDVPVSPGDAVVLHQRLFHGSGPNRSGFDRVAVAVRYRATRAAG